MQSFSKEFLSGISDYNDQCFENHFLDSNDPDLHFFNKHYLKSNDYISFDKLTYLKNNLPNKNFSLLHINCRSILNKLHDINLITQSVKPNVLGVTETWLQEAQTGLISLPDYNFVSKCRDGRGGGVGLFIDSEIQFSMIDCDLSKLCITSFEFLFIKIHQKKSTDLVIGVIYRPPGGNLALFNEEFCNLLSQLTKSLGSHIFLLGDFNINLLNASSHTMSSAFFDTLTSHYLLPAFSKPTRITPYCASLIDNIFTNFPLENGTAKIIIDDLSDHLPIFLSLNLHLKNNKSEYHLFRLNNEHCRLKFYEELTQTDWSNVYAICNKGNASDAYSVFFQKYSAIYINCFPLIKSKLKSKNSHKEWMTPCLLKSCKKKSLLYRKYLKNPTSENKSKFTVCRNKFKSIKLAAVKQFYSSKFQLFQGNLKKTWALIKSLISNSNPCDFVNSFCSKDGHCISSLNDIADSFNTFFSTIGSELASKIGPVNKSFDSFLNSSVLQSMVIAPTNPTEIIKLAGDLKASHSCGCDDIDPSIAKSSIKYIAPLLSSIINCSLDTGVFPSDLKMARVIPLFKSGEKNKVTNYRPISILPYFSKFFEKVMCNRLYNYFNKFSLFNNGQFGFRKGHSTYMALMLLYSKITEAIDKGEYVVGVFLDLAKAFDTVNHSILIHKLEHYGVKNNLLNWFISYLKDRSQTVYFMGTKSTKKDITCGVPQGSVLGPLLFLIYINDLCQISTFFDFILFADDTNAFASGSNPNHLSSKINSELVLVSEWFNCNRLSLNLSKTNYIIFHSRTKKITDDLSLSFNNNSIARVSSCKFLGVVIDEHLTWSLHIANIKNKISKNIGIISRIRNFIDTKTALMLYYSMVYPYLTYGNIVWASNYKSRLTGLVKMQKHAIRIMFHLPPSTSTKAKSIEHGLLNVIQINLFLIGQFMFKYSNSLLPSSFNNFFLKTSNLHNYNLRTNYAYRPDFAKTNMKLFSIKCIGPRVWSDVPPEISSLSHFASYKKLSKLYFLSK